MSSGWGRRRLGAEPRPDTHQGFRPLFLSEVTEWRKVIEGGHIPRQ